MANLYDLLDPTRPAAGEAARADALGALTAALRRATGESEAAADTARILTEAASVHGERILRSHARRAADQLAAAQALVEALRAAQAPAEARQDRADAAATAREAAEAAARAPGRAAHLPATHLALAGHLPARPEGEAPLPEAPRNPPGLGPAWLDYLRDSAERGVLTLDALRKRGDIFLTHEAAGCPPVLVYDYETVMDGRDLPFPSNYVLLRILPPPGVAVDDTRRPYIIIDPRAGHGPGIGGFKTDSQVGVALREGHPVYVVSFRRMPEPDQFLAFVTRAEAAFVREVMRRHPEASKPIVIGNCQGGWATLLLAATNPDLTGPIVVNGAPVAPWAGRVGTHPMRYNAGVLGGAWVPMALSDLGAGLFDGAHLVQNFELLNPSRTLFRKYTDLFRDIDKGDAAFLEFERWWGGFFLLTEGEIRWIVEQLFVGNRLVKNEARIEPGRPVDLKAIRAPIIVFASHGDNITPPQQALNWIAETYADVAEIRIRGQRIVYMIHDQVGHLGIFVSSQIARKEHSEMASTLKTIEALAPGLYEMRIEDVRESGGQVHFTVDFAERTLDDIRALDDGFEDERPFAAVARASEIQAQVYDALLRPAVRAAVTPRLAEAGRALHPQRLSRAAFATRNPAMAAVGRVAERVRETRRPAAPDNPFRAAEALWVAGVEQGIDLWRDLRDMGTELMFHAMWNTPWARAFGRTHEARRTLKSRDELRVLPEVASALAAIGKGGFAEAVIRMLVLLAEDRGEVRRDRLERSAQVLTGDAPFRDLGADRRAEIIHEQTLIATYDPDRAIETLPLLLPDARARALAVEVVEFVPGARAEMSPRTIRLLDRFRAALDLPPARGDVTADPLAGDGEGAAAPVGVPDDREAADGAPETDGPMSGPAKSADKPDAAVDAATAAAFDRPDATGVARGEDGPVRPDDRAEGHEAGGHPLTGTLQSAADSEGEASPSRDLARAAPAVDPAAEVSSDASPASGAERPRPRKGR